IIALAKAARKHGGIYASHMRNEGIRIDDALDEVFRIAREADIPAEISHLKLAGRASWGRMPRVLARIDSARAAGLDVTADQYPYIAGGPSHRCGLFPDERTGRANRHEDLVGGGEHRLPGRGTGRAAGDAVRPPACLRHVRPDSRPLHA